MKLPTVRDFMDHEVHTLQADAQILDAVAFLLDNQVTGAPVVAADNEIVGILTEKDCLRLLALGGGDAGPVSGTVADFMSRPVTSIPASMNIYFAAGMFLNDHVRRFPVTAHANSNKLVGAITRFDILRAIRANLN